MNLNSLASYKTNIIIKHSLFSPTSKYLIQLSLSYNTSKYKSPISSLVLVLLFSLTLCTPAPYVTRMSQLSYLSNLNYLVLLPFLFENILMF